MDLRDRQQRAPTPDAAPTVAHSIGDLESMYRVHGPAVYGLARRICGEDGAEDVTQDVFVRMWRNPDGFDPARGSLRGYLLRMAHSTAVDRVRATTARRNREERSGRLSPPVPKDVEGEVLQLVNNRELSAALDRLPVVRRDAIVTAFFGHHTYIEAARLLGQPVGTVKSRIRQGLKDLSLELRAVADETTEPGESVPLMS